jgi:glycosyltransferase involved in cell wall biosynthesis
LKPVKKVITITNYYYPNVGGITTYVETLRKGLVNRGYENRIVCYPLFFRRVENSISNRKLWYLFRYIHIALFVLASELILIRSRLASGRVMVHTHSANFCLVVGVLSRLYGCRTIHTFHSPIDKNFKHLEKFLSRTEAVVFVSEEHIELYRKYFKISNEVIEVIPGVVDQDRYRPRSRDEINEIKKDLQKVIGKSHIDDRLIVFVGRIIEEKGAKPLVESMPAVTKAIPDAYLVLVGPHSRSPNEKIFYDELLAYVDKHGLGEHVLFTGEGTGEMIARLYSVCRLVVVPSIWEASGIVPIEAMASGKPVIVTRVGGLQSRIVDGKTGFLVRENDPGELSEKIVRSLKDDKLLKKMGKYARKHVERKYPESEMVDAYLRLYEKID